MSFQLGTLIFLTGVVLLAARPTLRLIVGRTSNAREAQLVAQARTLLRLAAPAVGLAVVGAVISWSVVHLPVVSLLAATAGVYLLYGLRRSRVAQQGRERERAWPAALSQLADGLEGGLAFPAAVAFVGNSGPTALRVMFNRLHQSIRDGHLDLGLDELAHAPERAAATAATLLRASFLDTPSGRAAPLVRELAAMLRERSETREKARNRAVSLHREAAILAISPLAFLLLIGATAPGYLNAYRTLAGTLVSVTGAIVIGGCYLAMRRLGRIPDPGGADQ